MNLIARGRGRHAAVARQRGTRVLLATAISVGAAGGALAITPAGSALAAGPAIFTTTDVSQPHSGACLNGDTQGGTVDVVDCNLYADKGDVWLNGGSGQTLAGLADGTYFYAVVAPGSQKNPNDGSTGLLSTDAYTNREFTVSGGTVSFPTTTHAIDSAEGKVQLVPFADTPNPGGVYIAAVCRLSDTGTQPGSACKFDAFKVQGSSGTGTPPPVTSYDAPGADKTASPSWTRNITWQVNKTVDGVKTEQIRKSSSANVTWSVSATKTVSDTYGVTGEVHLTNGNPAAADVTVTDNGISPSLGESCTFDGTSPASNVDEVPVAAATADGPGTRTLTYTCTGLSTPNAATAYFNSATIDYTVGAADDPNYSLGEFDISSDSFTFPTSPTYASGSAPEQLTVSDPYVAASCGTSCPSWLSSTLSDSTGNTPLVWTQTIFNRDCATYRNVVSLLDSHGNLVVGADAAATAAEIFCGPNSGGLTMGWWQNKNGQNLLKAQLGSACQTLNGYLPTPFTATSGTSMNYLPDAYLTYFKNNSAYQYDASKCGGPTTSKSYLPTFTTNAFTAANASGTGTQMEEGQFVTTALNTFGFTNLGAGAPTLNAGEGVVVPGSLVTDLGLTGTCPTISELLTKAAAKYNTYSGTKTSDVTNLITLLTAINQNQAQTCQ